MPKTAADGLMRRLAQAGVSDAICVNGIAPGLVDTKMSKVTARSWWSMAG